MRCFDASVLTGAHVARQPSLVDEADDEIDRAIFRK
jgi:hypothetical protein